MADANTLSAQARSLWAQVQNTFSSIGYSTTLTSAGRSASYNAGIPGASSTSQHIGGNAFDFQVRDTRGNLVDPLAVQATLANQGLSYGQNIAEFGLGMGGRNHLSVPTASLNGQTLIGNNGKYSANVVQNAKAITAQTEGWGRTAIRDAFKALGLNPDSADKFSDSMQRTGDVMSQSANIVADPLGTSGLILRGSVAIVGVLLLAAAIFTLVGNQKSAIIRAVTQ